MRTPPWGTQGVWDHIHWKCWIKQIVPKFVYELPRRGGFRVNMWPVKGERRHGHWGSHDSRNSKKSNKLTTADYEQNFRIQCQTLDLCASELADPSFPITEDCPTTLPAKRTLCALNAVLWLPYFLYPPSRWIGLQSFWLWIKIKGKNPKPVKMIQQISLFFSNRKNKPIKLMFIYCTILPFEYVVLLQFGIIRKHSTPDYGTNIIPSMAH